MKISGYLEVGINTGGEVVVIHKDIEADEKGVGHIIFSPEQARDFARILIKKAYEAEKEKNVPKNNLARLTDSE